MKTKPEKKDCPVSFRTSKSLKKAFDKACSINNAKASTVLQRAMSVYVTRYSKTKYKAF